MISPLLQFFLILFSILFLVYLLNMIRQERLELKYALLWIITSLILIVLSLRPELVSIISTNMGIELPVNAVFLIGNFFMLMILFSLTIALSRHSNRTKNLTQEIAILKTRTEEVEKILNLRHKVDKN